MTDGPSPHLTPDELDVLVSGGPLDERRAAHVAGCAECADQAARARRFGADVAGLRDRTAARTAECREADEIALCLHAPEGDSDAAAFLTHAATCDYCGPLVEAAMHATAEEDDEDRALMTQLKTAGPEWQRQMAWRLAGAQQGSGARQSRLWTVAALLAVAAAVILAVRVALPLWRGAGSRPELQELVAAVGNERTRPVDGRLTGGFAYGPPPTLQRGPGDAAPPRVRIAEAKLEEAARANDTPDTRAALGVGLLAVGDLDKAIDALEEAVQERPGDARFQSDLAAAYLARAKWNDRAQDWPRALAAAERAIKADPKLTEAYFNRALALEGLHLDEQAAEAWSAYQALEKNPGWRDEAGARAQKLKQRSSADQPRGNQEAREHIEDVLLMQWGEAVTAGRDAEAKRLLNEAEKSAAALAAAGGDTMARDETALIRRNMQQGRASALKALADGHILYGRAREEFRLERLARTNQVMSQAEGPLRRGGSPYANWAPIYNAIALRVSGAREAALEALERVPLDSLDKTYFNLRGRYEWTRGVALDELADRYDLGREHLTRAVEAFRHAGERENTLYTQSLLAEASWFLGDRERAWTLILGAHQQINVLPFGPRRAHIQFLGASFALAEDIPEAALDFENATLADMARAPGRADEVYVLRARILARLGDYFAATNDLNRAQRAAAGIEDPGIHDRAIADVRMTRAELLLTVDNSRAVDEATQALDYVRRADPTVRLATLLTLRGKGREALGALDGASADLQAAAAAFERKRATMISAKDRMRGFDNERMVYATMTRHFAVARGDSNTALQMAERERAGALLDRSTDASQIPVDPSTAFSRLPDDLAVVYFATLPDRVLTWVLTRESCRYFSRPVSAIELGADSRRIYRAIQRGADLVQLRSASRQISVELVEPALRLVGSLSIVVFIPDGPLSTVPFAALSDAQGQPLLATRTVGVAPSLTSFMAASSRLAGFSADDVMSVGDGHDPALTGLPRLTVADEEAREVARLYPQSTVLAGAAATTERFLASDRSVLHFAGHAVVNLQFPLFSKLLLAPDAFRHDDGTLLAANIPDTRLAATRVVVLATCDGAAGTLVEGEGVVSMARVFLAAGVPAVVASLWPVDDEAHALLMAFHRELRKRRDAAAALRAAQMAWLAGRGLHSPVRLWGGFESLGGITPVH